MSHLYRNVFVGFDFASSNGRRYQWRCFLWQHGLDFDSAGMLAGLLAVVCAGLAFTLSPLITQSRNLHQAGRADTAPGETAILRTARDIASYVPPTTLPLDADDEARAMASNAAIPFGAKGAAARSFLFGGTNSDRAAALQCLATAVLYEAGAGDTDGQRAVAQVILNRVRHSSFPKTVCGVVLQGSPRSTGCQFTFVCDGSLARRYPTQAWANARDVAASALAGYVDPRVGRATHYHADYVAPAWSNRLNKVAKIGRHIFYTMPGRLGESVAFVASSSGTEVASGLYAAVNGPQGHGEPAPLPLGESIVATLAAAAAETPSGGQVASMAKQVRYGTLRLADPASATFVLRLSSTDAPGRWAMAALDICKGSSSCSVYGFVGEASLPSRLPLDRRTAASASFYYQAATGRAFWNCRQVRRQRAGECIPGTTEALTQHEPVEPVGAL